MKTPIEKESDGPKLSKADGAERAARVRAAIISLLNNSDEPMSKAEIQEKLSGLIEEVGYKTGNFENLLYMLVQNELVKKVGKNPNGPGSLYASAKFEFPLGKTLPDMPPDLQGKKGYKKRKGGDTNLQSEGKVAPMTIDIVKSTGRIRVHVGGLLIEIGVVDDQ